MRDRSEPPTIVGAQQVISITSIGRVVPALLTGRSEINECRLERERVLLHLDGGRNLHVAPSPDFETVEFVADIRRTM
jgi:hypothetical protein